MGEGLGFCSDNIQIYLGKLAELMNQRFAQSNYASIQTDTRQEADLQAVYQYVPTLKQSGFIIGNPVAYTNQPTLPPHMSSYSPKRQQLSPNHFASSQNQFRGPYLPTSPNRQKSKSRIVTHITYNNPVPPSQTAYYQTNNSRIMPGTTFIHSPPTSPSRPTSSVINHNFIRSRPSEQTISRHEYERCRQECREWEQKYRQIVSSNSYQINAYGNQNNEEIEDLRSENQKLRQKIRKLESKQQSMVDDLENVIISLTNKYRDSALKECILLTDRFRLEKKANQRF